MRRYDFVQHMADAKQAAFERQQRGLGGGSAVERKVSDYGPADELERTLGLAQAYLDEFITDMQERSAMFRRDDWGDL
jgi:hypothetical protein